MILSRECGVGPLDSVTLLLVQEEDIDNERKKKFLTAENHVARLIDEGLPFLPWNRWSLGSDSFFANSSALAPF